MAGVAQKRRAAAMRDGAAAAAMRDGAAILEGRRAGEGRVVLSPLTSFYQGQHNHSPHVQVLCNRIRFGFCVVPSDFPFNLMRGFFVLCTHSVVGLLSFLLVFSG